MELTREETIKYHREMWNWIADQIIKSQHVLNIHILKHEYVANKFDPFPSITCNCFACEYAKNKCARCPVEWENEYMTYDNNGCPCETWNDLNIDSRNGLYGNCRIEYDNRKLRNKNNWKHQAELARRIANLPEREVEGEV